MGTEVWAVSMFKDEADIAASTVGRMQAQVDHVLVADNGSTDGTRESLERLGVEVIDDPDPAYNQSAKMSALAAQAREWGAEWIVPFDADEVWRSHRGRVRDVLAQQPPWVLMVEGSLYDHVATAEDDPAESDPVARLCWRRPKAAPLPKMACRAVKGLVIHQGNHGASFPGEPLPPIVRHMLSVRHFPYRSVEQFVSKVRNGAAAYAATDLPEDVGGHWRGYGRILDERGEAGIEEVFRKWFWRADPRQPITIDGEEQPALTYDPVS